MNVFYCVYREHSQGDVGPPVAETILPLAAATDLRAHAATEPTSQGSRVTTVNRAVERALSVLEAIAASPLPAGLSAVARATGFPKTTVHRLLPTLVSRGLVARHGNLYTVGRRWATIGPANDPRVLSHHLMPVLLDLYQEIRSTVTLGVLCQGDLIRYSDPLYDRRNLASARRAWVGTPAHCTAAGKVLLAYHPSTPTRGEETLVLAALTEHTITNTAELRAVLTAVRRCGIATAAEEYRTGEVEVAAPVFGPTGQVVAALTVIGHVRGMAMKRASALVLRAAHAASGYLRLTASPEASAKRMDELGTRLSGADRADKADRAIRKKTLCLPER